MLQGRDLADGVFSLELGGFCQLYLVVTTPTALSPTELTGASGADARQFYSCTASGF